MKIPAISFFTLLSVALGTVAPYALAQDAASVASPASLATLPASPFPTAKTVQVTGSFSLAGPDGLFTPIYDLVVTVDSPDRYRIDAKPLMKMEKPVPTSFYFNDGTKQYEFNSLRGRFKIADARKPGEAYLSDLSSMAGLDLILSPGNPAKKGTTRTITEESIDGQKMIMITDQEAAQKTKDGKSMVPFQAAWINAETGLPLRTRGGYIMNGVIKANIQMEYKDWKLDAPVSPTNFVWTQPAGSELDHEDVLPVGTVAPDFKAVTPAGKTVRLSDFKGKVVVLDFWATWCGPCQVSLPHLQSVYNQVKSQGVVVLALCVWDDKPKFDQWTKTNKAKYSFLTAFDPSPRTGANIAATQYKATGIPTQYVIGKDGKIAAAFIGYGEGDTRLEDALRKLKFTVKAPAKPRTKTAIR